METSIQVICRHNTILALLQNSDYISTDSLARELKVSVHTIRRDLSILENQRQLYRCHGGAGALSKCDNREKSPNTEQNIAIAKKIVEGLEPGSCFYIDSPSIGEVIVSLLPEEVYYLIIKRIELISIAQKNPFINIFFLGEELSLGDTDCSIQISMAKWITRQINYCIIEVDDIDNGTAFDNYSPYASVKRHFLQRSQRGYIVCRKHTRVQRLLVKLDNVCHDDQVFWLT